MILLAGCGALGSQIALHLATPDRRFLLIDDDHVEEHNVGTSAYSLHHVGAMKAVVLAEMLWRKCEAQCHVRTKTLGDRYDLFSIATAMSKDDVNGLLIVDTFDNIEARSATCNFGAPTLHVGVSEQRTGAVTWDEDYTLPESQFARGENPICTHHLGRRILRFTAAVAAEAAERFLETGERVSCIIPEPNQILKT